MRTSVLVIVALTLAACLGLRSPTVLTAHAEVQLDQATKEYLEGSWLAGEQPVQGACTSQAYSNEQYEFEFRNSGGRLIYYQPFDLFTNIAISAAERDGDLVTVTLGGPDQGKTIPIRVRLLPPDRIEFLSGPTATASTGDFAYRCARPNRTVTDGLSQPMMRILTSAASGITLFIEARSGMTDAAICGGSEEFRLDGLRWLQFEVIGPVHYYVIGQGFGGRFDLQPIDSVRAVDDHTLTIEVLERLAGAGRAWDPGSHSRPFTLTAIWDGSKLRIPELDTSFVRCIGNPRDGYVPAPLPNIGKP